jgi:broad specificity phosphatase PhoE
MQYYCIMQKIPQTRPERIVILGRHGRTASNEARLSGTPDSRVQGFNPHMEMTEAGIVRAAAFGFPLGRLVARRNVAIVGGDTSQADRAQYTSQLSQRTSGLAVPLQAPDARLNELNKGDLEGMLRAEAYPEGEGAHQADWHLRHGKAERGGETAWEASERWLDWFVETTAKPWPPVDDRTQPSHIFRAMAPAASRS